MSPTIQVHRKLSAGPKREDSEDLPLNSRTVLSHHHLQVWVAGYVQTEDRSCWREERNIELIPSLKKIRV